MGMKFDPWQENILYDLFKVDANGNWANAEYGLLVGRQSGKSYVIAAYLLAHLFLFPSEDDRPKNILFSAHLVSTTAEIFKRVVHTINSNDALADRVSRLNTAEGREIVELLPPKGRPEGTGASLRTQSRSKGGGRGFSYQIMCFDEAQIMKQETLNALDYTQATFTNTQMFFAGTVPQPEDICEVFEDLRDRGRTPAGEHDNVGWAEWSPEGAEDPDKALVIDYSLVDVWAQANPAAGYKIKIDRIAKEYEKNKKNPEGFAKERLSIWPSRRAEEEARYNDLDLTLWDGFGMPADAKPSTELPWAIVPVIGLGGGYASVCAAARLPDERIAVVHLKSDEFRTWVAQYLKEASVNFPKSKLFVDGKNTSAIERDFFELGIDPVKYSSTQIADAFEDFHVLYQQEKITHYNQPELLQSFQFAQPRKVGNMGYTWEGTNPNISPTQAQAATLAVYAAGDTKNFADKKPGKLVRLSYR